MTTHKIPPRVNTRVDAASCAKHLSRVGSELPGYKAQARPPFASLADTI